MLFRYLLWRLFCSRKPVVVKTLQGQSLVLRPPPADDLVAAVEVFNVAIINLLKPLPKNSIRFRGSLPKYGTIGANVGYSMLFFAQRFPTAKISCFEPIPEHIEQLHRHVAINQLVKRVDIVGAAAGNRNHSMRFFVDGICSKATEEEGAQTIVVRKVDVFSRVSQSPVRLLKIDIEGAEFEFAGRRSIRLSTLPVRCRRVAHKSQQRPHAEADCRGILLEKGNQVLDGNAKDGSCGIIWAHTEKDVLSIFASHILQTTVSKESSSKTLDALRGIAVLLVIAFHSFGLRYMANTV